MSKREIFYAAGIVKEDEYRFTAYVPDFPEIATDGQSWEEAFSNVNNALNDAIKTRIKQHIKLPPASKLEDAKAMVLDIRETDGLLFPPDTPFFHVSADINLLYGLGPLYDTTNKRLFGYKEVFSDLLRFFVPEKLWHGVKFDTLEKQKETFITSQYGEIRDDVIWRMKKNNKSFFIYIIAEFQSTVVNHMAVRIAEYVSVLRKELVDSGEYKDGTAPIVLPIVLYRGIPRWTAPLSLGEMLRWAGDPLASYSEQRYFLIDIHRLTQESLKSHTTIPAVFFQMERAASWEEMKIYLKELCTSFKGEHYKEIRDTFLYWSKLVVMPRFSIPPEMTVNKNSLEELADMSYVYSCKEEEDYYTKWRKDLESEARREGEIRGEKNARISLARNLSARGYDVEEIALCTELSRSEVIDALQENVHS